MVAATLHDIVRRYQEAEFGSKKDVRLTFDEFPDKVGSFLVFLIFQIF